MNANEQFMNRCLELAKSALGPVAPNPLVGAVVVYKNTIIGEGYHKKYGGAHAEVNAINSVKDSSLLKHAVLYVNLEPCSHTGKTPPCTDLIISSKIKKVVIGTVDPNSLVSGKGIEKLMKHGVNVQVNILNDSCIELNKRFFTFYTLKRPYIILKWAQTKDGYIDTLRKQNEPTAPNWISNELSRMLVHKWRSEEQAILIGTNTALLDNPKLTTREWFGRSPVRLLLDKDLRLPNHLFLFDKSVPTLVFNQEKEDINDNPEFIQINFNATPLITLMNILFKREIQSVIVEGGKMLIESFIRQNLWDEARVFIGDKEFKQGISAPGLTCTPVSQTKINKDRLLLFKNQNTLDIQHKI